MNRTMESDAALADVPDKPMKELSALRNVKPPAALVARVMTKLAEPRMLTPWQWLRRPFTIEIKVSPLTLLTLTLGLAALFVLIGATIR
jgi:hypothetical protein